MKRTLHILAIAALLCGLGATQAFAQAEDLINARLALHASTHNLKGASCTDALRNPVLNAIPCESYTTTWPTSVSADVWYVLGQASGPGFTGVTSGIEYDPIVGLFASSLCATLEFPNGGWPASGGGNVITWESCAGTTIPPSGAHAVAYVFYMYAYGEGTMRATENRNLTAGPNFELANCGGQSLSLWNYLNEDVRELVFGVVHFGGDGSLGYTPCGVVATQETTWGNIKNKYNTGE